MGGLFTYILAGGGFVFIGASESIISTSETLQQFTRRSPPSELSSPSSTSRPKRVCLSSSSIYTAISLLSFLFILNSIISLTDALKSKDQIGVVLQLEVIPISSLFFLFAVLGLTANLNYSFQLPSQILDILCLFGFVEEFFLFYLRKKDLDGIENRYFDLLLVPICVCIFSTMLELRTVKSKFSRLGRGVGLVLQGMWFIQMGLSFYSNLISDGCSLRSKSRGNFTIRCKGHPEFHRARAIATLQFNCHLALLVCFIAGIYAVVCKINGVSYESMQYKPLGAEMQHLDNQARFTLDSDDDNDHVDVKEEGDIVMEKSRAVAHETGVNGYGSHH